MAKRILSIVVICMVITSMLLLGCNSKSREHLKAEYKELLVKNTELVEINNQLKKENKELINEQKKLNAEMGNMYLEIKEMKRRHEFWKEDNKQYVVVIKIKEFHYSLNPATFIKDNMNAIKIPIQVSKQFYDSVKIGDNLNSKLRIGSLLIKGNFGDWDVTISEKKAIDNIIN